MQENCFIKMGHDKKKQQHKPKEGMQVLPLFLSHSLFRLVVMKHKLTLLVTFSIQWHGKISDNVISSYKQK